MSLRDTRSSRHSRVFTVGALLVGLNLACTGAIDSGGGARGGGKPSGNGGGNSGNGSGGNGSTPPIPEILPEPVEACESKEFTPARVWRLSDDQFMNAISDLLPGSTVPTILTPGRSAQQFIDFAEQFEINPAVASSIRASVTSVAESAVRNLDALLGCKPGQDAAACAKAFNEGFASRAFRRPLEDAEKQGLDALYKEGAAKSQAEGVRMVIAAVLQSGSFLYRTELGRGTAPVAPGQRIELTLHELASALSFLLLNTIPDASLRAAADDGSLAKADVFRAQVDRLLSQPKVQDHLAQVFVKYMGLGLGLDPMLGEKNKDLTPELKTSMEGEVRQFLKDLLTNGGTIKDLITSNKGFSDANLAKLYGVPAPSGTGLSPVTYPAAERSGILTLSGIIGRYSVGHPEVFIGKFIRDEFLCYEISPPPDDPAIEQEAMASANLPVREQSDRRVAHGTCGGCHRFMDPAGLTFMNYDALGRYRKDGADGKAIDASGKREGAGDVDGPVKDAVELGQRLAKSKVVRSCIESKMFGYALGRLTGDIDSCELKRIDKFVADGGGKLSDLMAAVMLSSAFRTRPGGK